MNITTTLKAAAKSINLAAKEHELAASVFADAAKDFRSTSFEFEKLVNALKEKVFTRKKWHKNRCYVNRIIKKWRNQGYIVRVV